jgi:hypothetical protein
MAERLAELRPPRQDPTELLLDQLEQGSVESLVEATLPRGSGQLLHSSDSLLARSGSGSSHPFSQPLGLDGFNRSTGGGV